MRTPTYARNHNDHDEENEQNDKNRDVLGSSVGQGFLSRCGLGAMGRRLGSAFFLFAALVPWVVAWTMVSFSLWSWRDGSWAGQCFLCRGPSVAGWAVWIVVWIVAYLSTFGYVTYVRMYEF